MKLSFIFLSVLFFFRSICAEGSFDGVKQGFFACDDIRNVTILPYIQLDGTAIIQQLLSLVKSLLDTPCITVWIYSPLQARLIRQQREKKQNYNHFIETELQGMNEPDKMVIVLLLFPLLSD